MILNNIKDQSLERNSNFELLRIIAMFEIVIWHIIIHGKVIDTANPALSFILRIILFICITHVNSFAMISGYFQYDKKFKPKKIILLILTLFFYNFIINLIFFKMGITSIGLFDLFMRMSPLASNNYWFLTSYIILYLISPFINRLINSLNKKEHLFLIFTLSFIYFLLPILSIGYFNTPNGYTPIQLLIFYIIGSYVNKYKIFDSFKTKKEKKIRQINLLLGSRTNKDS